MILLVLLFFGGFVAGQGLPCGYTTVPQSRVIGGEDASPGAWPWQIALLRYGRFICGGSLISANWVVTAAHCVSGDQDARSYQVVVGDHNRNVNEGTEQKIAARRIFGHPSYNRPSRLNNDIALIQLMSNVSLSKRVNPICLPSNDLDILTGSKCFITGWGKIEHPGSSHHTLQQAMMPPIDQAECRRKIQATGGIITLTPQMLCAGVKNTRLSGCHGDSGGPYVCLNADQKTYTLHGAVSWGSPTCNSSQLYTVFARVTQFLPWIKQHKEHGDGGGGSSPPPPPTTPAGRTGWSCGFEDSSICNFTQEKSDTFDWRQNKGSTSSSNTGPSSGHGGSGYYMYIETSSPRQYGDYATLISPVQKFSKIMCLTFYYHMYGSAIGNLTVSIDGEVKFFEAGNQGNQWVEAKINIDVCGDHPVIFTATRGRTYRGDIAIDDISLKQGSCTLGTTPPQLPKVFKCSFDNSTCGLKQSRNDTFDWTRYKGRTPSSFTGPSSDHSSGNGYYMYIEASSPRVQGDYAVLSSPALLSTGNTCITFYYHMYGSGMGNLTVNVNGRVLFRKSGNKGDRWIVAKFDNYIVGVYKVVFNATRGSNFKSDIAIDDVIVRPGSCLSGTTPPQLPKVFKCSFDNSICGLKQSRNDTFDWTRNKGSTLSSSTGPSSDHSSGNGYYMYIEASSPRVQGDYAVLSSPALLSTGNTCITFYYHMYGSGMGNLTVNVNGRVLFRKSGNQGDRWIVAKFDNYIVGVYKVVFNATRGSNFKSDIAIDDVIVRPGSCLSVPVSSTAPPVVTASPAPVSNVIKCSFSTNSSCGFTQSRNDKFDWTRHRGITTSSSTGPSSDHTGGNGYYMYIETSGSRKQGDYAELLSPAVKFGGQTCLQFFYHMYGATIGGLLVFVDKKNLFSKIGNQGNKWLDARINISKYGVYKVSFVGVRGSSFTGDIAIDDISLRPGPCLPGPPTVQPCIPPLPASCGLRPHTRIVGGTVATPGSWPWQTMLRSLSGFQFCGGTLVSDEYVITAAHCIGSNPFQIRLGAHKRTTSVTGYEQDFNVSKVITHPLYQFPQRFSHDIAIVKLSKPAQLNRRVHPACLPLVVPAPINGERCWITGWGTTSAGGPSPDVLLQASVPIVSRPRCDKAYPNQIHDSMICAGLDQGGIDSCQGDSGGPMVCETGGRYYLHGVTSWGYGCALPNKFGVYAKVTYRYLLDWIMSEIAKK